MLTANQLEELNSTRNYIFQQESIRKQAADNLRRANDRLSQLEGCCGHDWSAPSYVPDRREAYTIPGDEPGTMGVDWRGPTYVEAKEIPKWTRKCKICGKVETTDRVAEEVKKVPRF